MSNEFIECIGMFESVVCRGLQNWLASSFCFILEFILMLFYAIRISKKAVIPSVNCRIQWIIEYANGLPGSPWEQSVDAQAKNPLSEVVS